MNKFIEVTSSYTHEKVYMNVDSITSIWDKKAYNPRIRHYKEHKDSTAAILQYTGFELVIMFVDETAEEIMAKIYPPQEVNPQAVYLESLQNNNEAIARETNRLLKEYAEKKKPPRRVSYPFRGDVEVK